MHLPNSRLPKQCYKLQKRWTETDTKCWALDIRDILFRTGFGEVCLNQGIGTVDVFLKVFKTRLFDLDMQTQSSEIQDMDRLRTYKILKTTLGCEQYVFAVKNNFL